MKFHKATSIHNNLTMSTFCATLLGLMSIRMGTNIVFKFPEQK